MIFSDIKGRLGACATSLKLFISEKSHPLRFCMCQNPFLEILQPFFGKNYQPASRVQEEKGGNERYNKYSEHLLSVRLYLEH